MGIKFDLLGLHDNFQAKMNSLEKVVQILKYHTNHKGFSKEEVELLMELDEYILLKPLLILTGKSKMSEDEYEKDLKIKTLYAQKLLHSYIEEAHNNLFKLKKGEMLSFDFSDLIENEI